VRNQSGISVPVTELLTLWRDIIDFDVFKELTLRRTSENVTYNDVLRDLLNLSSAQEPKPEHTSNLNAGGWSTKGVTFPEGTEFRAKYKGQTYYAKVEAGALVLDGKRYDSPSRAAVSITSKPWNGWHFWECRFPGKTSWQMIKALRKD
jgi:hypothetical protein